MIVLWPILGVFVAAALYFLGKKWRDQRFRTRPFPQEWMPFLQQALPFFAALPDNQQSRMKELVQIFVAQKKFYGCAGLSITDEMRVTIASQACLLVLNQPGSVYPKLSSVLVYPSAFRVRHEERQEDGTVADSGRALLGESWSNGRVVLSWDDVAQGVSDFSDGHNVAIHEFAHQLDSESGATNGAPLLQQNSYRTWANVLGSNFEHFGKRASRGKKTAIDYYGATNPAEFFAVATETFFEKPEELQERRPELFDELVLYYQVDPRQWQEASAR